MDVHVLVPAAGSGSRIGGETKKQYLVLGDRPILALTLSRLAAHAGISAIHLLVPAGDIAYCRADLVHRHGLAKIGGIIAGGAERQDSVRKGLEACGAADDDIILVHDGVRPFFPLDRIDALVRKAADEGAALLAIPAQDTLKEVCDGRVTSTLDRSLVWQAQTPQAFRCGLLREAHRRAKAEGHRATDDASLLEWYGQPVAVVPGHPHNFKVTTPADLALARALLETGAVELT